MSVEREPNHKRRHHRVTVPLFVVLYGTKYRAHDWSLGGFQLTDFRGEAAAGSILKGSLNLPYAGFSVDLPIEFEIVRRQGSSVGCRFLDLSDAPRRALRHLLEASIEGRLGDAGDVIGVLSEPVSSSPIEELLEEEDSTHIYLGKRKLIRTSVFYVLLGLLSISLLGALTWRNAMFIDIPDGIVMGNFISIATPVGGRLDRILVQEGAFVQQGEPLFHVDNSDLTAEVGAARAALETSRARAAALRTDLEEERERLKLYAHVTEKQVAEASAAVDAVDAQLNKARVDRDRQERLNREGVVSDHSAEIARSNSDALAAQRREMSEALNRLKLNLQATREGRFFSGKEVEGRTRELTQRAHVAHAEVGEAEERLKSALAKLEQTQVDSLTDGHAYTIYRHAGELLGPNDVVLSIRAAGGYWAVGRLQGDEAIRIRPGMDVEVLIPSLDVRLKGRVGAIGHQALSTASQSSADMESSLKEVPIKIVLPEVDEEIPPGIRARIRVHLEPHWGKLGELRVARFFSSLFAHRQG